MSVRPTKKPYSQPRLVRYGRVEALTTGVSGSFGDKGTGGKRPTKG